MARMIPPVLDLQNTPSPGERQLFQLLQSAPGTEDWTVLHSQRLARVPKKAQGEADFVVLVPNRGILVLEVKAHKKIARENGVWLFGEPGVEGQDPFDQVSKAMHSIRQTLGQELPMSAGSMLIADAVVFTSVTGTPKSPEWRANQLIEADEVTSTLFPAAILRALDDQASHFKAQGLKVLSNGAGSRLSEDLIEQVVEVLRRRFDLVLNWSAWHAQNDDRLLQLTSEQYRALDYFVNFRRVLFEGPAGTGKTVLAIEAARRALDNGERVLLACHNKPLALHLRAALKGHPNAAEVEVGTFHSYLMRLTGSNPPSDPGATSRYFQVDLPELALDWVTSGERFDRSSQGFDTVVIDELQDLAFAPHLQLVPSLLRDEALGRILAFGDLENQAFFDNREPAAVRQEVVEALGRGLVSCPLTVNCRNTQRTVNLVEALVDVAPPYSSRLRELDPGPQFPDSGGDPGGKLVALLGQLLAKGVKPLNIAVLSLTSVQASVAKTVDHPSWQHRLKDIQEPLGKNDVLATSVFRFKGLERPVIILTDGEAADPGSNQEAWYVGLTRSTAETYVLCDGKTRDKLLARLLAKL